MKTKQDVMNKVKELREVQTSIDKQIRVQKALMQAFSKKGIQALIMDNVAVELETIVNDLLYKITDGKISVRLLTQKENKDGSLKEVFDVIITDEFHSSPFNLYSGGEKFRIAFAIRVALSMLLARRSGTKISAIFYDEAFNDLDKSGIDKLMEIFQILSKEFKHQLIITHQTELKNKFTDVLTVHKTAEGSKIIQV
jgi:exonuclease SbcC